MSGSKVVEREQSTLMIRSTVQATSATFKYLYYNIIVALRS